MDDQSQVNNSYESVSFGEEVSEYSSASLILTAEKFVRVGPEHNSLRRFINTASEVRY